MPIYVYECRKCERVFETEQRITADALTDCEECGSKGSLRRLIQPVGVSFKGAGFHINDYSPKPTEASAPASESKPAETKSEPTPSSPTAPAATESPSAPKE
jgi:putative FmdB family regulatory protein